MLEQGAIVLAKGGKGPAGDRPEGNFTRKPSRVRHQAGTVADMRGVGDVLEPPKLIRCSRSLACPSPTPRVTCARGARARAHMSVLPGTGPVQIRQHGNADTSAARGMQEQLARVVGTGGTGGTVTNATHGLLTRTVSPRSNLANRAGRVRPARTPLRVWSMSTLPLKSMYLKHVCISDVRSASAMWPPTDTTLILKVVPSAR